jgi:ankyrin repeat protein
VAAEFLAAVKKGDRSAVDRMLDADPGLLSARDGNGTSAVLLAHYHGKRDVADALLARRPTLDIFEAATVGDAARVAELVTKDPSLANAMAGDGFQPLGLAAFFKRRDAVKALLDAGAQPSSPSRGQGFTPLHSAVATDAGPADEEIVRMLLDAGADPNARSTSGGTPLHAAAFTGDREMLELLLAYGADPGIANEKGLTPLDLARDRGNAEVAAVLHHAVTNRKRGG